MDGTLDAAVLDSNLSGEGTAFPIADRLHVLGVPHLFATGAIQVRSGSDYGDRPRLEKPFLAGAPVRAVEDWPGSRCRSDRGWPVPAVA